MDVGVRMWGAWVDYLRLTLAAEYVDHSARERYHMAMVSSSRSSASGDIVQRPWSVLGYYGMQQGSVAWGESAQGLIIQASGASASNLLAQNLPYSGVPRIDLQLTVWYDEHKPGEARRCADEASLFRDKRARRAVKMRLIDGFGGGDTLYIGRRGKNSRFVRIYDKWRESGEAEEYLHAWRYELELSDSYAMVTYRELLGLGETDATVSSMVVNELARRGVTIPVTRGEEVLPSVQRRRRPNDADRRLRWLREQVAPSLQKLVADGVSRETIAAALELW